MYDACIFYPPHPPVLLRPVVPPVAARHRADRRGKVLFPQDRVGLGSYKYTF